MNYIKIDKTLKSMLDDFKDKSLYNLLNQDNDYKSSCKDQLIAESKYLNLNLSAEQRKIIDNFLSATDATDTQYSTLCYLAGILDSYKWKGIYKEAN